VKRALFTVKAYSPDGSTQAGRGPPDEAIRGFSPLIRHRTDDHCNGLYVTRAALWQIERAE
jgi:hypothetical protein